MSKAVEALKEEWYTLTEDHDEDGKPKSGAPEFLLRPLYGIEELDVRFRHDGNGGYSLDRGSATAVLVSGLVGWRNFHDSKGLVEFERENRQANLRRLTVAQIVELSAEVYARTKLTPEERKNLLSQSTSPSKTEGPSTAAPDARGDGTATTATLPGTSSSTSPASSLPAPA